MTVNHELRVDMTPKSWNPCWHVTAHILALLRIANLQHDHQHTTGSCPELSQKQHANGLAGNGYRWVQRQRAWKRVGDCQGRSTRWFVMLVKSDLIEPGKDVQTFSHFSHWQSTCMAALAMSFDSAASQTTSSHNGACAWPTCISVRYNVKQEREHFCSTRCLLAWQPWQQHWGEMEQDDLILKYKL